MKIYFKWLSDDIADVKYKFLSNFYPAPIRLDGKLWLTTEHYYQAMKTTDVGEQEEIRKLGTPGEAKKHGKIIELRSDWEDVKIDIMRKAVRAKFEQDEYLRNKLFATEDNELIEYAPWGDTFWGVDKDLEGQNILGKILMEVREEFKKCM